ncbi:MAG: hypothetical protein NC191_02760 [Muribaculaceae bacterium]|nr:hypothetical protein [Muribaculaceae bacterium]
MKKIVYCLILIALISLPVLAANWVIIGNNTYIDSRSIRKNTTCSIYNNDNCYSAWVKINNTNNLEQAKTMYVMNCGTYEIAEVERTTPTDFVYGGRTQRSFRYSKRAVAPESLDETIYNYVCK